MFILVPCELAGVLLAAFLVSGGLYPICSSMLKGSVLRLQDLAFGPRVKTSAIDAEGVM